MRRFCPAAFVLVSLLSCQAFAEESLTPKATLCSWTQHAASWTMEQILQIYQAQGEKETAFARAMAGQASSEAQLQKAVREKWGKEAELAVARAIDNDTLEDDQAATEKIDGDHATLTFKDEAHLENLYLIKVSGEWRLDVATYVRVLGDQLDRSQKFLIQSQKVVQSAMGDLEAGKYNDSSELVGYLKAEFKKVAPAREEGIRMPL